MIVFKGIFEFPALFLKLIGYHTWSRMFLSESCLLICLNFYSPYISVLYICTLYIVTPKPCFVCKVELLYFGHAVREPTFQLLHCHHLSLYCSV